MSERDHDALRLARLVALDTVLRQLCPRPPTEEEISKLHATIVVAPDAGPPNEDRQRCAGLSDGSSSVQCKS
jgi:hypothetical protein